MFKISSKDLINGLIVTLAVSLIVTIYVAFKKRYFTPKISNILIPTASININGFLLGNPKRTMMKIGNTVFTDLMNDPDFKYEYFNLSYRNNIQLVFLKLDVKGYCIYNRHISEPLECPMDIDFGSYIAFPPWSIGIHNVK